MNSAVKNHRLDKLPGHVPPGLVYDYDYINDPRLLEDPHARMRSLILEAPPIFYSPCYGGHWVVTRRQPVVDITTHPEIYSSTSGGIPEVPELHQEDFLIPIAMDPPRHTAYRVPVNQQLSIKAIAGLETAIRTMSHALIDKVLAAGRCDFLKDIAEPLPVTLFMQLAGMPTDRLAEFRRLAARATASVEGEERSRALQRITAILSDVIQARQAKREDDLISRLLDANINGHHPTRQEMMGYSVLLFIAGLETVVNALSFGIRYLARDPELQARLRSNPSQLPAAIEELLRLHGIATTVRQLTRDETCHGVQFKQGDKVMLLLPAANYDDTAFPHPERFVLGRSEQHMTFNTGPHRCVGLNLARLELRVFYEAWLRRVPPFRLDPRGRTWFMGGFNLAVMSLPLVW